jgi:hypothetical protein
MNISNIIATTAQYQTMTKARAAQNTKPIRAALQ